MIYICCIKYGGEAGICVLVVENMRARRWERRARRGRRCSRIVGGCRGRDTRGKARGGHADGLSNGTECVGNRPLNFNAGDRWILLGTGGPRNPRRFNRPMSLRSACRFTALHVTIRCPLPPWMLGQVNSVIVRCEYPSKSVSKQPFRSARYVSAECGRVPPNVKTARTISRSH
ncbi:hypothetical protein BC827DRAFT_735725 [Russula dissimulans]|nr:hypothetical protein BC827DRAFT_735725 [Russula dissimulans]